MKCQVKSYQLIRKSSDCNKTYSQVQLSIEKDDCNPFGSVFRTTTGRGDVCTDVFVTALNVIKFMQNSETTEEKIVIYPCVNWQKMHIQKNAL